MSLISLRPGLWVEPYSVTRISIAQNSVIIEFSQGLPPLRLAEYTHAAALEAANAFAEQINGAREA